MRFKHTKAYVFYLPLLLLLLSSSVFFSSPKWFSVVVESSDEILVFSLSLSLCLLLWQYFSFLFLYFYFFRFEISNPLQIARSTSAFNKDFACVQKRGKYEFLFVWRLLSGAIYSRHTFWENVINKLYSRYYWCSPFCGFYMLICFDTNWWGLAIPRFQKFNALSMYIARFTTEPC